MPTEHLTLRITWAGDDESLAAHRLSLARFAPALKELLAAYRRVASSLLRDAVDDGDYGAKGGRYARAANDLDLELESLEDNCVTVGFRPTVAPSPQTSLLQNGFAERSLRTFVDAVGAEAGGHAQNAAVRKYLGALPPGVSSQKYELRRGAEVLVIAEFGVADLIEITDTFAPWIEKVTGLVSGVDFDPVEHRVRIQPEEGPALTLVASSGMVERALELRGESVDALAVRTSSRGGRLLRIEASGWADPLQHESAAARIERIGDQWRNVLDRLGQ